MANAEKSPEEPPHKKSKSNHTTDNDALDFFLEPLWQNLANFDSTLRIEAPTPALPAPSTRTDANKASSRYDNAPSLFELVQRNLLQSLTPAPPSSASTSTSSNDSSMIPQKRSRWELTEDEVTVETQYDTPSANFTHTQTSLDTQEARSIQTNATGGPDHSNAITADTNTFNVSESNQCDSPESVASNAADVRDDSQPNHISKENDTHSLEPAAFNVADARDDSQSNNISNEISTYRIHVAQITQDDDDSDMSIDQDDEELEAVEQNSSQDPKPNKPSALVDLPDDQESAAAPNTTNTTTTTTTFSTTQNQSNPVSNEINTHNINVAQITQDDDNSDMSIDQDDEEVEAVEQDPSQDLETNDPSVIVDVPDEEEEPIASPTIDTTTTTTTTTTTFIERQSSGTPLHRAISHHSLERYEEIDDDEEEASEEFVDTSEILIDAEVEQEESSQSSDEFYDVKETFSATVSMATTPSIAGEEEAAAADRQLPMDPNAVMANVIDNVQVDVEENQGDEQQLEADAEDQQDDEAGEQDALDEQEEGAHQHTDQGLDESREAGEISQESGVLEVESTQEPVADEQAQSPSRNNDPLEDGQLDTTNEPQSHRVDDAVESDTNENDDAQSCVLQDTPASAVQDENQDGSVPTSDDQEVTSNVVPNEHDTHIEPAQPTDELPNQDDQLSSFGTEDEQLIGIEEVHLLMDHQDSHNAVQQQPVEEEEEAFSTALQESQAEVLIQEQPDDVLPAEAAAHADDADQDQQAQVPDDNDTEKSDQQVTDDNVNTTGSQLLQSDRVHSFLLEEMQEIVQGDAEGAEDQAFSVEKETTTPQPHTVSRSQPQFFTDDENDDDASTIVADNDAGNDADMDMQDAIEESESEEAILLSQPASVMDDSVQEFASIRDSFALDLIESQTPFSQQSEEVEEYKLEESDEIPEDTQEPQVESRPATTTTTSTTTTSDAHDLMTSSAKEQEQEQPTDDVDYADVDPMYDDYDFEDDDDDEEDDIMMVDAMPEDDDIQTQQPVAVDLDDVPLSCLTADKDAMGGRTVCNMDLPPYAHVPIWWYDAHDSNQKGIVYLFGKVFDDRQDKYVSCCVRIKNIRRELYILPRKFRIDDEGNPTRIRVDLNDVQQELRTLLEHKKVLTYNMTTCEKQYAFSGTDIPRTATYIKLRYDYQDYEFPTTASGKTFSHMFGANTNPLEHFLIQYDIMGPCWLKLEQCTRLDNDLSWCALNIGLEDPQCCTVDIEERPAPPLNVMSLSLQTKMSRLGAQSNQVVAASLFLCKDVNIDTLDYTTGLNGYRSTIICLPPNMSYPADAYENIDQAPQHTISLENTEFALLSRLLAAIHVYDPDIISGHNFFGGDLDILLSRMKQLRVPHWHKLGRLKSKIMPKTSGNSEGAISSTFYQRLHMRGRIVCDTFEASQDLIKSKSFHLSELAKTQLDIVRKDIKPHQLDSFYKTGEQLVALAKHCSLDAYLTFALMTKLQILPLTKQLTRLSGNLWSRSIHGARSERNEYLLLHTFYNKGYLCPDRPVLPKKHSFEFVDEALELELPASKRRLGANGKEMPSFEGGLVLDPKTGIYDKYVLLLDFNSLYPSIMQEFNVCFTTMDVNVDEIDTEQAPDVSQHMGILPALVKMFVDRRKRVKQLMNDPSVSATAKAQYQIEQMGLKLTANSMYGCLGSSYSRFFARPLAAFITAKGRDILRDTVDIAQNTNSVDVIYGDTDSIMINTFQKVFPRANAIGQQLKQQVNTKYNMLEIDIDGVFRRTLLLKKKKYAAQVVTKQANGSYKETLEVKGLDIVRRDGCDLSRVTSEFVLQLVLSNQPQETIVEKIHEYIEWVAHKVHASAVPVNEYIIRKQLTKSPEEYRTTKGNPHVLVAKDMRRSGIAVKSGDTIPYIYCTTTTSEGQVVREPRMPDDVISGKAVIDLDWYLLKQVLPSVERICIPLEGTDRTKLQACLHINTPPPPPSRPRKQRQQQQPAPSTTDDMMEIDLMPVIEEEMEENEGGNVSEDKEEEEEEQVVQKDNMVLANVFKIKGQHHSKPLSFRCLACDRLVSFSRLTCTCGASLSIASLYCQVSVAVRRFIHIYYASPLVCTETACGFETRDQFPVDDLNCLRMNCPGKLIRQYSAGQLYDQIAAYRDIIQHLDDQGQDVSSIVIMLDTLTHHSSYNYIDLNAYV